MNMISIKPCIFFPYPATPSQGAWFLAVALIAHADLGRPNSTTVLRLDEIFVQSESMPHEWLQEITGRAVVFGVTEYESADFEEASFCSMCFFTGIRYRSNPRRVEVEFLEEALPYLKQLQEAVIQLCQRGMLSPSNLTRKMKAVAPLAEFDMKKNRRYKGSVFTLLTRNGEIVDIPLNH